MKLLTINSHRGMTLPGLRFSGLETDVARLHDMGWRIHVRGGVLMFESPLDERGKRRLYQRATTDFDLGWEMDDGEDITGATKWSSPEPEKKAAVKK